MITSLSRTCAKTAPADIAGPESRRIGSSKTSASSPISASCSSTMNRYALLVMTIGRSNSVPSDTRKSVFWNVERAPNKGRNCLGWTSRQAGHSRVPAPPHMIGGIIRPSISASNLVVVAVPRDKATNTILNGGLGPEADVAHQITDIGEGLHDVSGLHRQHILYCRAAQLLLQQLHHVYKLFRTVIAHIIDPRRRTPRAFVMSGNAAHKAQYYTGNVIDMGEIAAHPAMVKKLDWRAFDTRLDKQKNCHIGPPPWPVDVKKSQARDRKPIEVAVGIGHQLVGLFRRGVETDGTIGLVIDRKWQLCVGAVKR